MEHTLYIDSIDEKLQQDLNEIVILKVEDYEQSFFEKLFGYDPRNNVKDINVKVGVEKSDTTLKIINIAKNFFDKAGLKVNTNDGYITYYSHCYNTPKYIDTSYTISSMNELISPTRNVNFCIIITQKNEYLKYGDMEIYQEYPNLKSIFGYYEYNDEYENKNKISLKNGTVLVIDGNTLHKLQGCSGIGNFNFIQVVLYEDEDEDDYLS
jgi:hypothetical protein